MCILYHTEDCSNFVSVTFDKLKFMRNEWFGALQILHISLWSNFIGIGVSVSVWQKMNCTLKIFIKNIFFLSMVRSTKHSGILWLVPYSSWPLVNPAKCFSSNCALNVSFNNFQFGIELPLIVNFKRAHPQTTDYNDFTKTVTLTHSKKQSRAKSEGLQIEMHWSSWNEQNWMHLNGSLQSMWF